MIYCGVDTGTVIVGYALIEDDELLSVGHLECGDDDRYGRIIDFFENYFGCLRILDAVVGIEKPYVGPNRQTAINLGIAFGCIYTQARRHGFDPIEISPKEAKLALAGTGNASKALMLKKAQAYRKIDSFDEADAIGIALAVRERWKQLLL